MIPLRPGRPCPCYPGLADGQGCSAALRCNPAHRRKTITTIAIETTATPAAENGAVLFIPLNKLKKHPSNARKTPHSEASIEAKVASIHAKGILQNLVVEPELETDGAATGFYLVSIGEGRRLAQLLRVKRKQIKKTEPIRCVIGIDEDVGDVLDVAHLPIAAPHLQQRIVGRGFRIGRGPTAARDHGGRETPPSAPSSRP